MDSRLEIECSFETERLHVTGWTTYAATVSDGTVLAKRTISILTPEVTQALPSGWQDIDSVSKASTWLSERNADSVVLAVQYLPEHRLVGFMFLNGELSPGSNLVDIRLGYLLAKETWGKGLGSELIAGLVAWCDSAGYVSSIVGGVEVENGASIRVLDKNGFRPLPAEGNPEGVVFLARTFDPDS